MKNRPSVAVSVKKIYIKFANAQNRKPWKMGFRKIIYWHFSWKWTVAHDIHCIYLRFRNSKIHKGLVNIFNYRNVSCVYYFIKDPSNIDAYWIALHMFCSWYEKVAFTMTKIRRPLRTAYQLLFFIKPFFSTIRHIKHIVIWMIVEQGVASPMWKRDTGSCLLMK